MEQEQRPNMFFEPSKKPDSKKLLVTIIVILAIALIALGALYFFNISKNSQTQNETEKNNAPSVGSGQVENISTASPSTDEIVPKTETTETEPIVPEEIKKADLYVKSYSFSKDPKVGSKFTVKITIGNKGKSASSESYWEWWATASQQGCKKKVGAIAVDGSSTVECDYTYLNWDDYVTKAVVDSQDDIDESDEKNNIATKEVTPIHKKADLIISNYEFNHDPVMGEEFKVEITIENKGQTEAKDFEWEWWSNEYASSCDGDIDKLEAGESQEVSCKYTYGGWSTYATKAVVDPDDDVDEEEEDNNISTKTVIPEH